MEPSEDIHKLIAPFIIGDKKIITYAKRLLALQMFTNAEAGEKFHVMMVGDPSSGKTEIGMDISKILPNSGYAGSNVTRVGLIEKAIHCQNGLLVIDEFSRLPKNTREALLEMMQTGFVSIDKHNQHEQKYSGANILAICNPKGDRIQEQMPITKQVPFSDVMLTRFHVFIPFYAPDKEYYPEISQQKAKIKNGVEKEGRQEKMLKYIYKMKQENQEVLIPEDISQEIGKFIGMLRSSSEDKKIISPRLIEGITSMVRARARMLGKDEAGKPEFNYCKELLEKLYLKV